MPLDFDNLIALWTRPLPEGPAATAAFAMAALMQLGVIARAA